MDIENEWRDSALRPRWLIFDWWSVVALLPMVFYLRPITMYIMVANLALFWVLERFGLTVDLIVKMIRRRPFSFFAPKFPLVIRRDDRTDSWMR